MRTWVLALALLIAIASAQDTKPPPARKVLDAAVKQAASSNRNVFLIFHASWCGWCKKLDAALNDPSVKPIIDANYVVIHLVVKETKDKNALENPGGLDIMRELDGATKGLPFYAFIDGKGKMIANSNVGYQTIGYPGQARDFAAFENLLKKSALHMSDDQRSQVMSYFVKNEPKPIAVQENRDAIICDLNNLAAFSFQYRIRPKETGGGAGSYAGFAIPEKLRQNANATFEAEVLDTDHIRFKATSVKGFGTITEKTDETGRTGNWIYGGEFSPRPDGLSDAYRAALADTVKLVLDSSSRAVKSLDADRAMSYYLDTPDFALASNDEYYPSCDSLHRTLQSHLRMYRSIDSLLWIDPRVYVLGKDAATVTTAFYERVTLLAGNSIDFRGHFTFVLQRSNGQWKFVQVHASSTTGK